VIGSPRVRSWGDLGVVGPCSGLRFEAPRGETGGRSVLGPWGKAPIIWRLQPGAARVRPPYARGEQPETANGRLAPASLRELALVDPMTSTSKWHEKPPTRQPRLRRLRHPAAARPGRHPARAALGPGVHARHGRADRASAKADVHLARPRNGTHRPARIVTGRYGASERPTVDVSDPLACVWCLPLASATADHGVTPAARCSRSPHPGGPEPPTGRRWSPLRR
jgi:hypothetical protein